MTTSIETYEETPAYYWYTARAYPNHFRTEWYNGIEYAALTREASYEEIEKYDLRQVGYGDSQYIRGAGDAE